jgi:hypothetical protein
MMRITEYAVTYHGLPITRDGERLTFESRAEAADYVRGAVANGHDAAHLAVQHRSVTYGDWAPTTPVRVIESEVSA